MLNDASVSEAIFSQVNFLSPTSQSNQIVIHKSIITSKPTCQSVHKAMRLVYSVVCTTADGTTGLNAINLS